MTTRTAFVYSEGFMKYDFGPYHPMNQIRIKLTYELMKALGIFEREEILLSEPEAATEDQIALMHGRDYIDMVKEVSDGERRQGAFLFGLGSGDNPIFEDMYNASAIHTGATMHACDLVLSGEVNHAFTPAGGLHHASRSRASGFCVFNDPAIAIEDLLVNKELKRVVYIDIDAHHGDGVQFLFFDRPDVLTISIHESGKYLFPGSGFENELGDEEGKGFAVNVPLPPYTRDQSYIYAFKEIVPPLLESYKPDFIFTQLGADAHRSDPLTHLMIGTMTYEEVGGIVHEISHEICNGRWVGVGGGGYDPTVVPRIWTAIFGQMAGIDIQNELPQSWRTLCREMTGESPSKSLRDESEDADVPKDIKVLVENVKKSVFPYHGLDFN
ncbi:MAG: acetoin utilization protein AcuC [Thermoplasmata archaeon]